MLRLSHRDVDTVQVGILELNSHRDLRQFRTALPQVMLRLIPADYFVWNELFINPKNRTLHSVDFVESSPGVWLRFVVRISRIIMNILSPGLH